MNSWHLTDEDRKHLTQKELLLTPEEQKKIFQEVVKVRNEKISEDDKKLRKEAKIAVPIIIAFVTAVVGLISLYGV